MSSTSPTSSQSLKLRVLRIQATSEIHPLLEFLQRRDYLISFTICAFLSPNKLTSLELDLRGTRLVPHQSQEDGEVVHVCTSIAALLTTLRRLRLRMPTICADTMKPRQHSTSLRLNEVVINLSLSNESPLTTSAMHARCCGPSAAGLIQLKADIENQARNLATQMAAPRIVRVLTHALPKIEMHAFDVLTGKIAKLREEAEWDDDGETLEDKSVGC